MNHPIVAITLRVMSRVSLGVTANFSCKISSAVRLRTVRNEQSITGGFRCPHSRSLPAIPAMRGRARNINRTVIDRPFQNHLPTEWLQIQRRICGGPKGRMISRRKTTCCTDSFFASRSDSWFQNHTMNRHETSLPKRRIRGVRESIRSLRLNSCS